MEIAERKYLEQEFMHLQEVVCSAELSNYECSFVFGVLSGQQLQLYRDMHLEEDAEYASFSLEQLTCVDLGFHMKQQNSTKKHHFLKLTLSTSQERKIFLLAVPEPHFAKWQALLPISPDLAQSDPTLQIAKDNILRKYTE